jgi:hypothetical protein
LQLPVVEADGEYALGIYTPGEGVITLALRPAWWIGERVTSWSPCGVGHPTDRAACVPWSRVFDPLDVH